MDITLVSTHRCNLACHYCYAGDHVCRDLDADTLHKAIALLYADGAECAQLSFFGGEPFLAFSMMRKAVALARAEAVRHGGELQLQCTTNGTVINDEHIAFIRESGMYVTVSIDGIQPAHELNRPLAGGGSSFDATYRGLRRLLDAGLPAEAMMVITPQTVPMVFASVEWLWREGVQVVHANLALEQDWGETDRRALEKELQDVGRAQLARALFGTHGRFEPFEAGLRRFAAERADHHGVGPHPTARASGQVEAKEQQLVVATSGNLYPCAPMVGEDRDDGPEAALRIGHIDDGRDAIVARLDSDGAGCQNGEGCACAAYLETGNRHEGGPIAHWYGQVCARLGAVIETSLGQKLGEAEPAPSAEQQKSRRALLAGIGLFAGAVALTPLAFRWLGGSNGCERSGGRVAGELRALTPPAPGAIAPPAVKGKVAPPSKPPKTDVQGDTGLAAMPKVSPPKSKGDVAPPAPVSRPQPPAGGPPPKRGRIAPPSRPKKKPPRIDVDGDLAPAASPKRSHPKINRTIATERGFGRAVLRGKPRSAGAAPKKSPCGTPLPLCAGAQKGIYKVPTGRRYLPGLWGSFEL